jgi:hypothetical protein
MNNHKRLKAQVCHSCANMAVIIRQVIDELGRLNHLGQVTANEAQRRRQRAAGVMEAVARRSGGMKRCC